MICLQTNTLEKYALLEGERLAFAAIAFAAINVILNNSEICDTISM